MTTPRGLPTSRRRGAHADAPRGDDPRRAVPRPGPPSLATDAWASFETIAAARGADDRLSIVPVLGAGFNAQAQKRLGWRYLLVRVARDLGLAVDVPDGEEIVGNTTLVWEAMLAETAARRQRKPHRAELDLERHVRAVLVEEYPAGGATRELAIRLSAAPLRDVISFNFDLGFHLARPIFVRRRARGFDPVHDHALHATGARVWYPHGSVLDAASLQLGLRKYGLLIRRLELARRAYKQAERTQRSTTAGAPRSWVDVAMTAPLLFLGMSLGREEWALWWFLNQRHRNLARSAGRDRSPGARCPAFVLAQERECVRLATPARLAGLTLLPFSDGAFDDAWERVLSALTPRGGLDAASRLSPRQKKQARRAAESE